MEKNKFLSVSIILLAISIVFSTFWIGKSLRDIANKSVSSSTQQSEVLGLEEAAKYLKISESELQYFVDGKTVGLSYVKINDKYIFSKEGLNKWIQSTQIEVRH